MASVPFSQSDFAPIEPSNDKNVILTEIITNYLNNYFSDVGIFVSIILPSSEKDKHFLDNFFIHFFNDPRMKIFAYNVLDKLDSKIRKWGQAIHLIFVNNTNSVQ